jgi:protease-4
MKSLFTILIVLFSLQLAFSQTLSSYYTKYDFLAAPPSAYQDGLVGFVNPATLGMMQSPDMRFYWSTDGPEASSFNNWGLYSGGQILGFGMQQQHIGSNRVTDYSIALSGGSDVFSIGFGYDWSKGDRDFFARQKSLYKTSVIIRPSARLSFGATAFFSSKTSQQEALAEVAIRPFSSPRLTLFGDALLSSKRLDDDYWSAGAAVQVVPGINLVGRYFGNEAFTAGLVFDFGAGSIGGQSHFSNDGKVGYNSYMLRSGGFKNNIFQRAAKDLAYVPMSFKGLVDHQKFVLFDDSTHRLYDILRDIRAAADDSRINLIVINQTNMLIRPEHAWEIREALKAAQQKDKKVLIYFENVGMTGYHLASVADMVVMEPQGILTMPGLVMGKTYLKGSLEKLGIGFDEWRFFTHKTAFEQYSQNSLSDADQEQYNAYLDVWYDLLRRDISKSRDLSHEEFDALINDHFLMNAKTALDKKLVDKLERWSNIEKVIKEMNDDKKLLKIQRADLWDNAVMHETWGPRSKIALVYGLGATSMETGIRARYLERMFKKLKKDKSVKAVVFRVDSPGGAIMPGDVVADALKACAEDKPVIVSQGQVAGSGGYWISMYGDKIYAGPNTITGSIGVIGGWLWDKGFSEKLGITADFVQRGEHADLLHGASLPLLGLALPHRNLTTEERAQIEEWIRGSYDEFITKVAQGRDMTKEEVDKIAQGRFYAGQDGKENGLVDEIGGLMMALDFAKKDAGILPDEKIEIIELPKNRGLFELAPLSVSALDKFEQDPVVHYIKMVAEQPWQPLHMLPPGTYPGVEK